MQAKVVPNAEPYLVYDARFMNPDSPDGLWLCTDAEDVQAIGINAACIAAGFGAEVLHKVSAFFEAFSFVLVVGADPDRRAALAQTLRENLPSIEVCVTAQSAYFGCSSVRELRETKGLSAVDELWRDAEELPPIGLVEMSRVQNVDISKQPHIRSGIPALDHMIGGFYEGEVSVWTGKRKEGKSTILGIPILSAIAAGKGVCVYSGELPTWRYKAWLLAMAAGPGNLDEQKTDTGKTVWVPRADIARQIDIWWENKLFQMDNSVATIHQPDTLLGLMKYAWKRYGCSMFIVDNLMTVDLPGEDYYRAQSRFLGRLVDFAHETKSHVHLVAHRRKGGAAKGAKGDSDDVSGSGDITNRADNTFCVSRIEDDDSPYSSRIDVLANRDFGANGSIQLSFDPRSRRFYQGNVNWKAGWEKAAAAQSSIFEEINEDPANIPFP